MKRWRRVAALPCFAAAWGWCFSSFVAVWSPQPLRRGGVPRRAAPPSWQALEELLPSSRVREPRVIDSALEPEKPLLSGLTLFRERHGWCPYSERVWLTLEAKGLEYETVLIDNTGPGRRPRWFSGSTPQIRWKAGRQQGESLDIMRELDRQYPDSVQLWPNDDVTFLVNSFKRIFPSGTRPSSRAAFLFKGFGDMPVWRSEFEATLDKTNELLGKYDDGPFFYGAELSAADIAWAPFLERYSEQLPCLHAGLDPRDSSRWPRLAAWYEAMMQRVPAYSARVRGDNISWRKVLSMAGYGNAGVAPVLQPEDPSKPIQLDTNEGDWQAFASSRPHVAPTPEKEAAARVVRNRKALAVDAVAQGAVREEDADVALRGVAAMLLGIEVETEALSTATAAAKYLDERLCVPRDMGVLPSRALRSLAKRLAEHS
eukprot:TRINITY_DN93738_c0_g1_i1.p1 TRINITY_DN93738_c0_g1~~TRINITY_DN93738_c0_g1_i1.p1  ORF type:complete len:429 (+),score=58.60 TRINITY_DN93738_c0_g1_i1:2-1288(+)